MNIVNGAILKSPINWMIVWLMLLIAGIAGHVILSGAGVGCPHDSNSAS